VKKPPKETNGDPDLQESQQMVKQGGRCRRGGIRLSELRVRRKRDHPN
jgi:hypothetical protein